MHSVQIVCNKSYISNTVNVPIKRTLTAGKIVWYGFVITGG